MLVLSLPHHLASAIYDGTKRCELRKGAAQIAPLDKVVIYETQPNRAVTGFFIVESCHKDDVCDLWAWVKDHGITRERYLEYFARREVGFAIRIRIARRLHREITLREAQAIDPTFRPPQSFLYLLEESHLAQAIDAESPDISTGPAGPQLCREEFSLADIPSSLV